MEKLLKQNSVIWIQKWADYTQKYGIGYILNDMRVGILFNDKTKMIMKLPGITQADIPSS